MNKPDPNTSVTPESPAPSKKSGGFFIRLIVVLIIVLATAAAVAVAIPWGRYRYHHIVLSEATVRGTIAKIGVRLEGRIKSVEVEPGQRVSKGDVLFRMEDRHLDTARDRARGELLCASKDLESERLGIAQSRRRLTIEIERANAARKKSAGELEAARSNLQKAEKQHKRFAELLASGSASASEMDKVTGDRDRAQGMANASEASLEAAEANYQKATNELEGLQVRESRTGVLETQIEVARTRVTAAEIDLEAAVIRATEDGRVLERILEAGGSAKVGEPVIALWIGRAWVEAWADERDLRKMRVGSLVDISIDASPDHKVLGTVESIGLMTDKQRQPTAVPSTLRSFVRQSAMVPVRIALDEDNDKLQLGLSVMVGIKKETDSSIASRPALESSPSATAPLGLTRVQGKQ
ncbi:MAG: rane fusion protein multidrug efflux system [Verrucomicrobiota bacterium]|jgi:membrane fusion protein (multidrug efflux system)